MQAQGAEMPHQESAPHAHIGIFNVEHLVVHCLQILHFALFLEHIFSATSSLVKHRLCVAGAEDGMWDKLRESQLYIQRLVDTLYAHVSGKLSIPPREILGSSTWASPLMTLMESTALELMGPIANGKPGFRFRTYHHYPARAPYLSVFSVLAFCMSSDLLQAGV
jgi:hypothetical protein